MTGEPLLAIRQVRAIDAVATFASLAQAGEHLATSQSSVSRHVAEAERALGRRLFARGWTGMEPTSEGEVVIAQCRRMMATIDVARAAIGAGGTRVADLGHYLTWDVLRSVEAVRAAGSVSAAALALGKSQTEVSRDIGRLAAAIGGPLFLRSRTGMAATPNGITLADLHGRLSADMARLPDLLAALSGEVTGRVSVGLLPFSEQDVVPKVFGEMLRRHRHVRLQAVTGSYPALMDGLRQGQLDFVMGLLRTPVSEALEQLRLAEESFAIVARADHPRARQASLAVLAQETWIVPPHGTPSRRFFEDWLIGHGITPPAQTCEMVTFHLAEQVILHSDAIGLLTYSDRKRAALPAGLRILPIALPDSLRSIGLTYRGQRDLGVAERAFIENLARELPSGSTS